MCFIDEEDGHLLLGRLEGLAVVVRPRLPHRRDRALTRRLLRMSLRAEDREYAHARGLVLRLHTCTVGRSGLLVRVLVSGIRRHEVPVAQQGALRVLCKISVG